MICQWLTGFSKRFYDFDYHLLKFSSYIKEMKIYIYLQILKHCFQLAWLNCYFTEILAFCIYDIICNYMIRYLYE